MKLPAIPRTPRYIPVVLLAILLLALPGLSADAHAHMTPWAPPGRAVNPPSKMELRSLAQRPRRPGANAPSNSAEYYNWSGYAAISDSPFVSVQATFVQPTVTCPVAGAWTLFWIGFDGFSNGTVEQAGSAAYCADGQNAPPVYYAWWEMWPTNYAQVMPLPVKPSDKIHAKVSYLTRKGKYVLRVTNMTTHQQYTRLAACARGLTCARQSADWIVERPVLADGSLTPLADWGTMKLKGDNAATRFRSGSPVLQPISDFDNWAIKMSDSANDLARVGALKAGGTVFQDTWLAAQ